MSDGLPQVGTKSAAWLRQVGVRSRADLEKIGSVEAFLRVKRAGFKPTLNLLWSLEAALLGCHWTAIPHARREALKAALNEAEARLLAARAAGIPAHAQPLDRSFEASEDGFSAESGFAEPFHLEDQESGDETPSP
ncbi:MAG: hypothetical protein KatS3mg125_0767 [Lysobacterales bacterium]|jgi:hypothetical protein|nr:MAG: hypothetical protein KatS3mg125_0767 [Xanthomonadales bacterium]